MTTDVSSVNAIVMSDVTGTIVHWNDGARILFGYTSAEAVGESLDLIVPQEYRERHWNGFRAAIASGVCRLDRATTNIPVRCKDGTVSAFPGRFVFLQSARKEVLGAIALYSARHGTERPFGQIVPL
jgi:PAS domain S-box-containing protein